MSSSVVVVFINYFLFPLEKCYAPFFFHCLNVFEKFSLLVARCRFKPDSVKAGRGQHVVC